MIVDGLLTGQRPDCEFQNFRSPSRAAPRRAEAPSRTMTSNTKVLMVCVSSCDAASSWVELFFLAARRRLCVLGVGHAPRAQSLPEERRRRRTDETTTRRTRRPTTRGGGEEEERSQPSSTARCAECAVITLVCGTALVLRLQSVPCRSSAVSSLARGAAFGSRRQGKAGEARRLSSQESSTALRPPAPKETGSETRTQKRNERPSRIPHGESFLGGRPCSPSAGRSGGWIDD